MVLCYTMASNLFIYLNLSSFLGWSTSVYFSQLYISQFYIMYIICSIKIFTNKKPIPKTIDLSSTVMSSCLCTLLHLHRDAHAHGKGHVAHIACIILTYSYLHMIWRMKSFDTILFFFTISSFISSDIHFWYFQENLECILQNNNSTNLFYKL